MKRISMAFRLFAPLLLAAAVSGAGDLFALEIPLNVSETEGYTRRAENVSTGVPLPRGAVTNLDRLAVTGPDGAPVAAQFERLSVWPDSSLKWVLVDFAADCQARGSARYILNDSGRRPEAVSTLKVSDDKTAVTVETGTLKVSLDKEKFDLFSRTWLDHDRDGAFSEAELVSRVNPADGVSLEQTNGLMASAGHKVESMAVEAAGPVRATVAVKGAIGDRDSEAAFHYTARLHFYAGTGLVRVYFTLENRRHANPLPGMHWTLGRPGNLTFEDMSLNTALAFEGPIQMSVGDGPKDILDRVVLTGEGGIYQESSGGENWFHRAHMNAEYQIPMRFRGARAFLDGVDAYSTDRPDAWLHVADRRYGLAVAVRHFWQNFPKALTAAPSGEVRVALWPREYPSTHELQAGEIKTHETAFYFHTGRQGSNRRENRVATVMGAFHHPLIVRAAAEQYLAGGFFDDAVPYDPKAVPDYERLQQAAVAEPEGNLFTDRETADEYGWRNFGDTWANNETDQTGGPHHGRDVVSHFNLEYDFGYGMLFQSLRTLGGAPEFSRKWWELAEAALRHEADIDVFHNMDDPLNRGVYDGGKFTHTAHGVEAALSTHRGSPRMTWFGTLRWPWGEGSSPESGHFNTRGQVCYYYFTGDRRVLESALQQTELVYRKISENKFAQIENLSRESGNNLQIMTDAYLLTWDDKYRVAAEKILEATAPVKQWYMSEQGRREKPEDAVAGFWTAGIAVDAAARWTAVMEEKTGAAYKLGRDYVAAYADFTATYLAGGPEKGFYSSWTPAQGGRGDHGPWTYRLADLVMFGHKYSADQAVKRRCLKAAADAFEYMRRGLNSGAPVYSSGKNATMVIGGGHEYSYYRKHGRWAVPVRAEGAVNSAGGR